MVKETQLLSKEFILKNLRGLSDQNILSALQELTHKERQCLTEILHHLREVERRKLFCDLGYKSLFDYAVSELKYSEGQAGRRIQAMRLMKEIPQLEEKIKSGTLSLSNISQAQSYFRKNAKVDQKATAPYEKIKVLEALEHKSARDGQKALLQIHSENNSTPLLPAEKARIVSPNHVEMRFVINDELKVKIEEYKALLGPKATTMSFAELVEDLVSLGIQTLKAEKFGKKRTLTPTSELTEAKPSGPSTNSMAASKMGLNQKNKELDSKYVSQMNKKPSSKYIAHSNQGSDPRYISQSLKFKVWTRDEAKCRNCKSTLNLQTDHIEPLALGGKTVEENLRLLCHHCNQRAGIKNGLVRTSRFG